jgi:hypothetical protein
MPTLRLLPSLRPLYEATDGKNLPSSRMSPLRTKNQDLRTGIQLEKLPLPVGESTDLYFTPDFFFFR